MIVASVNLNKGLGDSDNRAGVEKWLVKNDVDLLIAQEPFSEGSGADVRFQEYVGVGGDHDLHTWIRDGLAPPNLVRRRDQFQVLKTECWRVYNCYLSAYSSAERVDSLRRLRNDVAAEWKHPVVIAGDFNLAPTPEDGKYGDRVSTFTSDKERQLFNQLLEKGHLFDSTRAEHNEPVEFTIERQREDKHIRFRCDLALVSKVSMPDVSVHYDHSVRQSSGAQFTDHSAILIDVPETLPTRQPRTPSLFGGIDETRREFEYRPHNTAMNRGEASPVARMIVRQSIVTPSDTRVLDYGCGRGEDVRFFEEHGMDASGWDPHDEFGFTDPPEGPYDLCTCTFVLNVLPTICRRMEVLKNMKNLTKKNGIIIITTRSPNSIEKNAQKRDWPDHNDGYWSSKKRKTFQKGIGIEEHRNMWNRLDVDLHQLTKNLKGTRNSCISVVKV